MAEATLATRYDGKSASELAELLAAPRVELLEQVGSTMDVAHALAGQGTPDGTIVLADRQTAGRGRLGRSWRSEPGRGIWLTLIERPTDTSALDVLSLRVGLAAAAALDDFAPRAISLKWPNDLYVGAGKLAGVLIEARWRDVRLDWLAIGFGLNVLPPPEERAEGLREGVSRVEVLAALVPALRSAAARRGALTREEVDAFAARDLAVGRRCSAPAEGVVAGITAAGALVVDTDAGPLTFRAGSLVLSEDA